MATTATLIAVSSPGTTNTTDNPPKRKSEENISPINTRKPTHRRLSSPLQTDSTKMQSSIDIDDNDALNKTNSINRTAANYRIPKLGR